MSERVAPLVRALVEAADEVWILAGVALALIGVALIYVPAALIIGGLFVSLIGVGRIKHDS